MKQKQPSAWIYQHSGQLVKHGTIKASWYVGWRDVFGRRHGRSFGPGEEGKLRAQGFADILRLDHRNGLWTEFGKEDRAMPEFDLTENPINCECVYFIEAVGLDRIKIGTTNELKRRLRYAQLHSPVRLRLLAVIPGSKTFETMLHKKFAAFRLHGEWFQATRKLRNAIIRFRESQDGFQLKMGRPLRSLDAMDDLPHCHNSGMSAAEIA